MNDRNPTVPVPGVGASGDPFTQPPQGAGTTPVDSLQAENAQLKAEIERLRIQHVRWAESERRIMELLGTSDPQKIAHDLRNLLNERDLLKTLVDQM